MVVADGLSVGQTTLSVQVSDHSSPCGVDGIAADNLAAEVDFYLEEPACSAKRITLGCKILSCWLENRSSDFELIRRGSHSAPPSFRTYFICPASAIDAHSGKCSANWAKMLLAKSRCSFCACAERRCQKYVIHDLTLPFM